MSAQAAYVVGRESAKDLRAVILLAGRVGRNVFADGVGRSVLDLPVRSDRTLLDVWIDQLDDFAAAFDLPRIHVCVSVDQTGALPRVRPDAEHPRVELEVVRDPAEYRGTAGVVRDLTRDYGDGDRVLVAAAYQIQREPLRDLFVALTQRDESVSIVPHRGSEIAGAFLLRCARLRGIPDVGFVDLKEQAIPSARGHGPLFVATRANGSMLPVRTLDEYVHALRAIHLDAEFGEDRPSAEDPFAETWRPAFAIVEAGAHVAEGAVLQDSVVLAGGRVEEGAAVARSVVCDRGTVRQGDCVVESMVTA